MRRKHLIYTPPSDVLYQHYYVNQAGSGIPIYRGLGVQRGHGLGSFLGGLMRSALPLLKPVAKAVGHEAINFGLGVAKDALAGKRIKASMKRRATETGKRLFKRVKNTRKPAKRRKLGDIFENGN